MPTRRPESPASDGKSGPRWARRAPAAGTVAALVVVATVALLMMVLTWRAGRPPGIDTAGHLFKAWAIARDAEESPLSLHGWTQYWYNGHPLYHYYSPASYFLIAAVDYVVDDIDFSYRAFIFVCFLAAGAATYALGRLWLGRFAAVVAALLYVSAPYTLKMVFWEGNLPRTLSMVLVPAIFYVAVKAVDTGERRYFAALAVAVAALVFAHHMPAVTTLVTLAVFLVIYALLRAPLANLIGIGAAVLLGLGISAFWLLPAVTQNDLPDVPNLGALPERLASYSTFPEVLLDPRFQARDFEAVNGYLGAAMVVAATLGLLLWRNRWAAWALAGTILFAVLLSMGMNNPLYQQVESLQRWFPERFLQPAVLLLALLAAAGVQALAGYARLRPLPRLLLVLGLLAVFVADAAPFAVRHTKGSPVRAAELSDTRLASEWISDRDSERRLFAFTGSDWSTSFFPARVAGIDSTSGWNPEGTPHSISIGQMNAALVEANFDYVNRTLALWDAGFALIDHSIGPRARLVDALEERGWERADFPFESEWTLLANPDQASTRILVNPLSVATIGFGGREAALISPNVGESPDGALMVEEQDNGYLGLFDTILMFGHEWADSVAAEQKLRPHLARGATVIEAIPGVPGARLFGVKGEPVRFQGTATIRNAPGVDILPSGGVAAGPFGFEGGPWTGGVVTEGANPLLLADIDGEEVVVAASKRVGEGSMVYLGLSLITQASLRDDPGATEIVRALLGYSRETVERPEPVRVTDLRWTNGRVRFEYEADEATTGLVSMTWFPGWRATIDGKGVELHRHERLTVLGLPAGRHTVELRYGLTPFQKRAGLLSLLAVAALTAGVLAPWRRWMGRAGELVAALSEAPSRPSAPSAQDDITPDRSPGSVDNPRVASRPAGREAGDH